MSVRTTCAGWGGALWRNSPILSAGAALVDCVAQGLGRHILDHLLGGDLDGFAGLWVASGAGRTLADLQFADTWQGDFIAILQGIADDLAELLEYRANGAFRRVGRLGNIADQLVFGHGHGVAPW